MNSISKKKPQFKISPALRKYLKQYNREKNLPVSYHDLLKFEFSAHLCDKTGRDTLWETVIYSEENAIKFDAGLKLIYAMLKTEGDTSGLEHLSVERVDYCTFGNSNPFRIRIINNLNDNYDYFYVKQPDASRVYGLELEHILSPNQITFLVDNNTLIEEHIAGIPGDQFINVYLGSGHTNKIRLAKEFVKFNERCFIRLLGDMRSYNYVVEITPDFDDVQYRIRAIDFDQQSYEGKKTLYMPQFFKENNELIQLCIKMMTPETVNQYQKEEHSFIARRLKAERQRIKDLLDVMNTDEISIPEKTEQLKKQLALHYNNNQYLKCKSMGDILSKSLKEL